MSSRPDVHVPFLAFDDTQQYLVSPDEQPMLFEFDDYATFPTPGYDSAADLVEPPSPAYELAPAYSPAGFPPADEFKSHYDALYLPNWLKSEPGPSPTLSPTSPIPIPSAGAQSHEFIPFNDNASPFSRDAPFSPLSLAAALPLPSSFSPSSSVDDYSVPRPLIDSVSPHETTQIQMPQWAAQLWDPPRHARSPSSPRSANRHSPLGIPRRNSLTSTHLFPSSSAPSVAPIAVGHNTIRAYSTRAESFSVSEDRDATVRRRKRVHSDEGESAHEMAHDTPPLKSLLRPPKLAPSAWQLYFTDWIQRQQASSNRKLNVAQAAKEAGLEYASLSEEEKEPYKRRSQAAKDMREKELNAYLRSLTPEDIRRENAFRSAQRKAGKSRRSNIKDPNAPKKPLSAYFMFLQRIRANPELVKDIFGDETETTKQSVLAAAKWRSMTDDERKPFLAQAEQEKMEYEAARRLYEDGAGSSPGYGTNINFSILPGSPAFPVLKLESESESEGFATDDGHGPHHIRSAT